MGEGSFDRRPELFLRLDPLGMHAERPRHCRVVAELQLGADHFAMRDGLIVYFDLPRAIVGDHDQYRSLVTDSRVDFDRIEAECSVAGSDDDWLVRKRQTCRDAVGYADADAAERSGIEHQGCAQSNARKTEEVAAIGNHNSIIADRFLER